MINLRHYQEPLQLGEAEVYSLPPFHHQMLPPQASCREEFLGSVPSLGHQVSTVRKDQARQSIRVSIVRSCRTSFHGSRQVDWTVHCATTSKCGENTDLPDLLALMVEPVGQLIMDLSFFLMF